MCMYVHVPEQTLASLGEAQGLSLPLAVGGGREESM